MPRRPWPMIVLRSPKGWTGPEQVDGKPVEGNWRSHQVPFADARGDDAHRQVLEEWLRSYKPEELFDESGAPAPETSRPPPRRHPADERHPARQRRHAAARPAAAGLQRRTPSRSTSPAAGPSRRRGCWGRFLRDVMRRNMDELPAVRARREQLQPAAGRHGGHRPHLERARSPPTTTTSPRTAGSWRSSPSTLCEGWLEGYLLTGRHGLFSCYEAFIHVVDSMFNQHAKWLKTTDEIPWRRPIASLNYLLTSHVWRQDHNGFSHQDPGFIDHVVNKKAEVVRVYLPPDANTLLSVADHCLRVEAVRQRHRGRQAAGAAVPHDGRGDRALHEGHRHLGLGEQRRGRRARRRDGLRRRRARRWRRSPRPRCCAGSSRTCGSGSSTSST